MASSYRPSSRKALAPNKPMWMLAEPFKYLSAISFFFVVGFISCWYSCPIIFPTYFYIIYNKKRLKGRRRMTDNKNVDKAFLLRWPASLKIYWRKKRDVMWKRSILISFWTQLPWNILREKNLSLSQFWRQILLIFYRVPINYVLGTSSQGSKNR